jgi:hypothetical protein
MSHCRRRFRNSIFSLAVLLALLVNVSLGREVWVVRADGVGPVKIGMTLSQLNTALHEKFSIPESSDEQGCFFVNTPSHPGILFMIENGRLVRVDVVKPGVSTSEGIQVGDSEELAQKAYDTRLSVEPHAYSSKEGHYLTVRSAKGRYGIRVETDKGKITVFYAGRFRAIHYIEGCE